MFSSRETNSTANTISTSLIQQASAQIQLPSTSTPNSNNITSSLATTLSSVKEQTRMHQQSVAATNLSAATKQKGKEISDDVVGVLVYYARATGEQFPGTFNFTNANASVSDVRIPTVPLANIESAISRTGSAAGVKIVSPADYLIAQGLAAKAVETFTSGAAEVMSKSPGAITMQAIATTQEDVSLLYNSVSNRAAYSMVEDIATSAVSPNLEHIYGAIQTTVP